jgi:hypothetical protein
MEEQLKHLENQMNELGRKLDHVYRIITGEEFNEETSVVARLKKVEQQVESLIKFKEKLMYIAIGAAAPALYGTGKFFELILNLLK